MLVGQRHDINTNIKFEDFNIDTIHKISKMCTLHSTCGIDYIICNKLALYDKINNKLVIA